jgi:ABC-type lipoprotein export system ATPase subunit
VTASEPAGAAIRVRELTHDYHLHEGALRVLDAVCFDVEPGEYVALVGVSGAGKSTMLSIIGGLERPQSGAVEVGGHDLCCLSGDDLAAFRRSTVGFVFQHFGLLDALTAIENVELASAIDRAPRRQRLRRANELLRAVGLGERVSHRPLQLSGGERQRVAIARALVNRPRLLLADEPTGNLDIRSAETVLEVLESAQRQLGCTLVVVTHNHALAARSDRILELRDGTVHEARGGP